MDFDELYASVDVGADEAEAKALEAKISQLQAENAALRSKAQRLDGLESKLSKRKGVLRDNMLRLFSEARVLVEGCDTELRSMRMAESSRR
jgi:predicted  nucleic acid-binding Zn-ribbon protein